MTKLEIGDASALSLLAESPDERTKRLVYGDLSPEARKIAEAMVAKKKTSGRKIKEAVKKSRAGKVAHRIEDAAESAVRSTADALLRWSK